LKFAFGAFTFKSPVRLAPVTVNGYANELVSVATCHCG
jgi:hypothetical protein